MLVPMMMSFVLVMILHQVLRQNSSKHSSPFTFHLAMKPSIIFNFLYKFPMMINYSYMLQVLRKISSELTMLFLYHV
jgi:cytochrome bd-type quinol oxidase subunit 2